MCRPVGPRQTCCMQCSHYSSSKQLMSSPSSSETHQLTYRSSKQLMPSPSCSETHQLTHSSSEQLMPYSSCRAPRQLTYSSGKQLMPSPSCSETHHWLTAPVNSWCHLWAASGLITDLQLQQTADAISELHRDSSTDQNKNDTSVDFPIFWSLWIKCINMLHFSCKLWLNPRWMLFGDSMRTRHK